MQTKTNTTPRRPRGTVKVLAEGLKISRRATQQALVAGMPSDLAAARKWRKDRTEGDNSAQRLRQERIKLVMSQREKIDQENRLRSGELCLASEAYQGAMAVGFAAKQALQKLLHDLPPRLEGLAAIEVFKVLKKEFHQFLVGMSEGPYFDTPEVERAMADFLAARPAPWIPPKKQTSKS